MSAFATTLVVLPFALAGYAYVGYPILLQLASLATRRRVTPPEPREWPLVTLLVAAYNEERVIREKLDDLLAADYPAHRRQVVVVSDASSDDTDRIVREEYHSRGVELVRAPGRGGKTVAENHAAPHLHGDIVVCSDASVRLHSRAVRELVRAFADPTVGVASSRSALVADAGAQAAGGEKEYIGYEMWVRSLESRLGSIVGASGALFAMRRELFDAALPAALARDFASAPQARARGFRAVSVDTAICYWAGARVIRGELRRKVRTMAQGLLTLWHVRALMNPFRYGRFAFMLASHKLARWLVFLSLPFALVGLAMLAPRSSLAATALVACVLGCALGGVALRWPATSKPPKVLALFGYLLAAALAGVLAWGTALRGQRIAAWEPTRRTAA